MSFVKLYEDLNSMLITNVSYSLISALFNGHIAFACGINRLSSFVAMYT